MNEEQRARLQYLRDELKVWEDRRRRARWSVVADKLYNCVEMDRVMGEMMAELHQLEELEKPTLVRQPSGKRRPREI